MLGHVPQETIEKPRRMGRPYKRYSDQDKADALAALQANGGNVQFTANQIGIPRPTLDMWSGTFKHGGELAVAERLTPLENQQTAKRDLLKTLEHARWLYLDRLTEPDAIAKTSGYYAAVTTKILTEQHQLLSGGATSRTELSLASFLGSVGVIEASVPVSLPTESPESRGA